MKTGFTKITEVLINPSVEELEEFLEEELERGVKYLFDDKLLIDIYMKNNGGDVFKHQIWLSKQDFYSKTGKPLYINCVGDTQFVEDESQLWDGFKFFQNIQWENGKPKHTENVGEKGYKLAKMGESDLLHFLKMATGTNVKLPNTNLFVDLEKLFEGDYSELRKDYGEFLAFLYVDEDMKQKVWREFLPSSYLKFINNGCVFDTYTKGGWEKWKKNLEHLKGHYNLSRLVEFKDEYIKSKREISDDGPEY